MIAWFAKNGVAANLLMGVILIAGIFSVRGLKMELFPDFDLDLVTISVAYPGAAPLEVEDGICKQIEEKIWDLTGIKEMTSFSRENFGVVSVQVERGRDAKLLADEIKVRVDSILTLPEEAEKPMVEVTTIKRGFLRWPFMESVTRNPCVNLPIKPLMILPTYPESPRWKSQVSANLRLVSK